MYTFISHLSSKVSLNSHHHLLSAVCFIDFNLLTSHFTSFEADTIVLMSDHGSEPYILEKPISKLDNLRMLLDLNGRTCEVVTGVSLGARLLWCPNGSTDIELS
jgi:Maf-like protein